MADDRGEVLCLLLSLHFFSPFHLIKFLFNFLCAVSDVEGDSRSTNIGLPLQPQLEVVTAVLVNQVLYVAALMLTSCGSHLL